VLAHIRRLIATLITYIFKAKPMRDNTLAQELFKENSYEN
jgi:hypothetical protein